MVSIEFEKGLEATTSDLSNSVDLLDKLLQESIYVSLIELSLSPQILA